MKDEVLTNIEAAALLRVHRNTLWNWRRRGCGPPFVQVGQVTRYSAVAISQWLEGQVPRPAPVASPDAPRFSDQTQGA